jgi:hypothetical protein
LTEYTALSSVTTELVGATFKLSGSAMTSIMGIDDSARILWA